MTKENKPKTKAQKVTGIVLNVLTYLFFAICIIALILSVSAKRDADGAVTFFGMQIRVVVSDSMAECELTKDEISEYEIGSIPVKSMIFIETVPDDPEEAHKWYSELDKGDVLTFRYVYVTQETITHRIKDITPNENGGFTIELIGDNKDTEDGLLTQTIDTSEEASFNYVIGKVTGQNYPAGLLLSALKTPVGLVCMIIIPCLIIMVFEIIRLTGALGASKRQKEREEQDKQASELEELKRQLAALQNAVGVKAEDKDPANKTESEEKTEENNETT